MTRTERTPPTPADPVPAGKSGSLIAAATSAAAAVTVAAQQITAAVAPYVTYSDPVRQAVAMVATLAAMAAVAALALNWVKRREARR